MDMTDLNIDTLARTIYGEARGESEEGKQAIANVVLNRVALADAHPHFGLGTAASACKAPFQFTCWNKNDPNCQVISNVTDEDPVFAECLQIASDALDGYLQDLTNGATYYYVTGSVEPAWAYQHEPCAIIGRHQFYKNIA